MPWEDTLRSQPLVSPTREASRNTNHGHPNIGLPELVDNILFFNKVSHHLTTLYQSPIRHVLLRKSRRPNHCQSQEVQSMINRMRKNVNHYESHTHGIQTKFPQIQLSLDYFECGGQVLGEGLKCCWGFGFCHCSPSQVSADAHVRKQQVTAQVIGSLTPANRPGLSS